MSGPVWFNMDKKILDLAKQIHEISSELSEYVQNRTIPENLEQKVGRHVLSNFDGLFDKISNELKGDAKFRAKATLAMSAIIEDFLNKKDQQDQKDQAE